MCVHMFEVMLMEPWVPVAETDYIQLECCLYVVTQRERIQMSWSQCMACTYRASLTRYITVICPSAHTHTHHTYTHRMYCMHITPAHNAHTHITRTHITYYTHITCTHSVLYTHITGTLSLYKHTSHVHSHFMHPHHMYTLTFMHTSHVHSHVYTHTSHVHTHFCVHTSHVHTHFCVHTSHVHMHIMHFRSTHTSTGYIILTIYILSSAGCGSK